MIRIKADRCGYDKYKCVGIPQISEDSNGMFDENVAIVASMKAEFNKLPMRIKGMVFSEDTTNMSWPDGGPHPEVPELTCRTNTDPLSDDTDVSIHPVCLDVVISGHTYQYPVYGGTSGWADLFNAEYQHGEDPQYFYRNTVVGSTNAVASDVFIITGETHWHNIYSLGSIHSGHNGVPNFTVKITDTMDSSIEMGPGLLEPMLDTDFDPVDISTIPAWEAGDDAFTLNNILINGWKGVVDDRFRNIYARLNSIPISDADSKLRNLTGAQNTESECSNFQITLDSGSALRDPDDVDQRTYHADTLPNADNTHTPITVGSRWHGKTVTSLWQAFNGVWWWTVEDAPNLYSVSGGNIVYGDNVISVAGLSGLYAPFYAYLMAAFDVQTTHTDVKAADVPKVPVEGGTPRMIEDGDVVASGGTVTNFTSTGSGASARYSWDTIGDNTAEIVTKTGPQLSEDGTADPEPGGIGIGGVRIIQGSDSPDPLVLYKIYHEDCISEIEKPEADAEVALHGVIDFDIDGNEIITPLPGSTITPAPGIVQPAVNIALVVNGSTETNTQSTTDVPTVEAVYNFIHGITAYNGPVADAKATPGIMGSTANSQSVYGTIVTGATPGTYNVVQNIITIQNGTVSTMGGTTAQHYVPEAQAVVDWTTAFVAGYTATGGTISIDDTDGEKWVDASTVFTGIVTVSDNVKVAADKDDRNLSPYAIPTVEAVYLYVEERVPGDAQEGYIKVDSGKESLDFITGYTEAYAGLVQPVVNISAGTESPNAVSPTAVPTVQAVIDYIHGTSVSGYTTADSRATATITELVSGSTTTVQLKTGATRGTFFVTSDMQAITDTVTVYNDPQAVPTAMAVGTYVKGYVAGYTAVAGKITVTGSTAENLVAAVSGTTARAGMVQYVRNILVGGTHSVSTYAVPTVEAVHAYIHGDTITGMSFSSSQAGIGTIEESTKSGDVVTGVTASGCTLGTFNVVSNILGATNTTTGALSSVTDAVPTAHAVVTYIKSLNLDPAGIAVSGNLDDSTGDWVTASTVSAGIYYVATNVVGGTADSDAYSSVPTVHAVYSFVSGYTASIGGFSVTAADKEDWETTGTPATKREAEPGIVGIVDTIVAASTVSNRTLSVKTVPTVAAVKDYVDEHIPGAPVSGQLDLNGNFVNGTTVTAGIVKVSTNVKGGAAGSDARTAVPTADAVYTFVSSYQAVIGLLYAPEDDTEEWQSDHIGTSGMITVVGNMDVAPHPDNRTISKYSVPTADAVYDFVHGLVTGATAGTMEEETPEDAPTGEACTGAVSGIVLVARNVWLLDDYADRNVSNQAVPTVEAVYNFIRGYTDNYAGGASYPVANILAIPGRLGVGADGTRDSWLTGTDYAPIQGVVQTAGNIVAGSTAGDSTTAVPTVRSIYNFVHSKSTFTPGRALATGSTITAPAQGTTVATYAAGGTPGTCYVCEDMEGLYGSTVTLSPTYGTHSLASVVPTVEAVKNYVAAHGGTSGGTYTGYFAADENGIADGIAIFGSTVINVTGRTTALTGTQSAWAVIWKNDNGSWGGTVGTTYSTGIKKVSYLVARRVNNEIKQVQYGGISIEGRWD